MSLCVVWWSIVGIFRQGLYTRGSRGFVDQGRRVRSSSTGSGLTAMLLVRQMRGIKRAPLCIVCHREIFAQTSARRTDFFCKLYIALFKFVCEIRDLVQHFCVTAMYQTCATVSGLTWIRSTPLKK